MGRRLAGTEDATAAAIAAVCLAWSHELLLARLTFDRQDPLDIGVSGVAWALVLGAWWVAFRTVPVARRAYYGALLLCLPIAMVLGRLAASPALERTPELGTSIQGAFVIAGLLCGGLLGWRGRATVPPWAVTGAFVAAAGIGAALRSGGEALAQDGGAVFVGVATSLPPATVLGTVLLAWLSCTAVALQRWGPLAIGIGTLAVALAPGRPPVPEWTAAGDVPTGPDIVVLSVDTLRADRGVGFMAAADTLAADGLVFTRAWSPAPWTLPSMATLMTGVGPESHGAYRGAAGAFAPIRGDVPVLAEALSARGYDTAAVLAPNAFVGSGFGFDRGFAYFDHAMEGAGHALPLSVRDVLARPMFPDALTSLGLLGRRSYAPASQLVDRAAAVASRRRTRPLFLWVHFLDCHFPYRNSTSAGIPYLTAAELSGGDPEPVQHVLPTPHVVAAYDHEVRGIDAAIERLLHALGPPPDRGRVVVLTSDHGEEFEEHDGYWHGHALWEEVVHVPLVMTGLGRAGEDPTPVGLEDVTATLARAAGAPWDGPGRDLARRVTPRPVRTWNLLYGPPMSQAVRDGDLKVIAIGEQAPQVYDLAADPHEATDLAPTRSSVADRLLRPITVVEQEDHTLTPAERKMLDVLGYLEE